MERCEDDSFIIDPFLVNSMDEFSGSWAFEVSTVPEVWVHMEADKDPSLRFKKFYFQN